MFPAIPAGMYIAEGVVAAVASGYEMVAAGAGAAVAAPTMMEVVAEVGPMALTTIAGGSAMVAASQHVVVANARHPTRPTAKPLQLEDTPTRRPSTAATNITPAKEKKAKRTQERARGPSSFRVLRNSLRSKRKGRRKHSKFNKK